MSRSQASFGVQVDFNTVEMNEYESVISSIATDLLEIRLVEKNKQTNKNESHWRLLFGCFLPFLFGLCRLLFRLG